jgi:hypothetical protein
MGHMTQGTGSEIVVKGLCSPLGQPTATVGGLHTIGGTGQGAVRCWKGCMTGRRSGDGVVGGECPVRQVHAVVMSAVCSLLLVCTCQCCNLQEGSVAAGWTRAGSGGRYALDGGRAPKSTRGTLFRQEQ